MLFNVRYTLKDYTGIESSTGISFDVASSFEQLDAYVLAYESVLSGISNAFIHSAIANRRFTFPQTSPPQPTSSSYRRLLFLCTNGERFASITIPSPRSLDYEPSGTFVNYKVVKGQNDSTAQLNALQAYLANTVLRDGRPFPVGDWQAALMENK